ncbi:MULTISPECIES: acetyl-CoA sensor PanZ family protein [unclassified Agarivorans]|uniref:acetyl-CoA sensor PanZ family protein n=1 Tax=Agarivorans sp. Z349TD_7 TaxID=3421431 RepID=UPI003D7D8659
MPSFSKDLTKISPHVSEQQWSHWQQAERLYYCVFNQKIVAYCLLSTAGSGLQVNRFIVRDITRRRGIGLFMFQQLLQLAQHKQLNKLIFPNSNDSPALAFYQHLGLNNQLEFQL